MRYQVSLIFRLHSEGDYKQMKKAAMEAAIWAHRRLAQSSIMSDVETTDVVIQEDPESD